MSIKVKTSLDYAMSVPKNDLAIVDSLAYLGVITASLTTTNE